MSLIIATVSGVLFTLIACYIQRVPVLNKWNLLLVLLYGFASFAMLFSTHVGSLGNVLIGVSIFLAIAGVFWLILFVCSLLGQNLAVNWPMAILFWIVVSGLAIGILITKAA